MIEDMLKEARRASALLMSVPEDLIVKALCRVADAIDVSHERLLKANRRDLELMDSADPMYDRLKLTDQRLADIASDMRKVSLLESPVGIMLDESVRPNGMVLKRISVPFGVVGIIFEARPNVTFDVFSLCLKSRNACVLKGGSSAQNSNEESLALIREALEECGLDTGVIQLLPRGHEAASALMHAEGFVDVIIPRGGSGLIRSVRENSTVPVIETGAGVCHTYIDSYADLKKAADIVLNAKTRRVSVCNALDSMLVHKDRLADLPYMCMRLAEKNVVIEADDRAYAALNGKYPSSILEHATEKSLGKEYLDYRMSVIVVDSLNDAISHIARYGSHHSESIVTERPEHGERFQRDVDAACVYVNVSTAFTDGGQFGLGAEIGISTQKLHARGPMGLRSLTTYKWLINGDGQTRN